MLISLPAPKWFFLFMLAMFVMSACSSGTLDAHYKDLTIQAVQVVDANGGQLGGKSRYVRLQLESSQDLAGLSKGLLQFRAYIVLPGGERFLTLGTGTIEDNPGHFKPYKLKKGADAGKKQYSVFFFRDLILDYDGTYKVDLIKDTYSQVEFDVSYRIFSGPQLARSKTLIITKADFLKHYEARKTDAEPVLLQID
ncbi:MAG: hypothetical protein RL748_769 [Pseudomonadota bacterium]|jgi:hypothetical protein